MQIDTLRFGIVEIDGDKILNFKDGLPGLEEFKEFAILQFEESYPIIWMQSTSDRAICLPVIDSFKVLPEYTFDISDEDVQELKLQGIEDVHIINVLVIPENLKEMTVNLAAPIVINMRTGAARQIILNSGEFTVRYPIFDEILKMIKEEDANAGVVKEAK